MPRQKKSNTNFVAEQPRRGWAYFPESDIWRRAPEPWGAPRGHYPGEYGDWVAVSKPQGWQPPTDALGGTLAGESLLGAGGASLELFTATGGDAGVGGGHMKIGAGRKPQGYDAHGRYTGPGGGSASMRDGQVRLYADEADENPGGEEPAEEDTGGEQEEAAGEVYQELEGVLAADSGQISSDAGGGLSGGTEVRGPVTPPLPPAPEKPHLRYSQSSGELQGPDGKPLATGYAGRGGGLNNPDAEGLKGVGPLPQGNWRMEELDTETCKEKGWPEPAFRLTPDEETRKRVEELGRDPDSFYVHAKAREPKDQGRDSWGCIALDKPERKVLRTYNGRWIRVER